MPDLQKEQQGWLKSSTDFLVAAKTLASGSGAVAPIVHNAWQSIENGLKVFQEDHTIHLGHDFGKITRYLVTHNALTNDDVAHIGPDLATASGSVTYSDTKYPGDNPAYWDSLPRTQITNIISSSERIHDFVLTKIGISKKDWWDWWSGSAVSEEKTKSAT